MTDPRDDQLRCTADRVDQLRRAADKVASRAVCDCGLTNDDAPCEHTVLAALLHATANFYTAPRTAPTEVGGNWTALAVMFVLIDDIAAAYLGEEQP